MTYLANGRPVGDFPWLFYSAMFGIGLGCLLWAGVQLGRSLIPIRPPTLAQLVAAAGERASMRFLEFFAANIRNPHTRWAYYRAAEEFLAWCSSAGVPSIGAVQPVHVATWILAVRWLLDQAATSALWGARHPNQLEPIDEVFGWSLDAAAKSEIERILEEEITDPVGPKFMAPPPRREGAFLQAAQ
jgi:hypothetical protein